MVKKLPIRQRMKPVINALREGKKTWSELKAFDIPDKTLHRILEDYLKKWGLADKEGDYWVWYEYSRVFKSRADYDLAIDHSRQLLPALRNILEVATIERHPLYSYVKEHLRFYPETYRKLEKFEEAFNERVRELFHKQGHRIITSSNFLRLESVQVKGRFFSRTKFVKKNVPLMIGDYEKNLSETDLKEIKELRDLLEDTKAFNERFEIYRELAGDISLLIAKVEVGLEPLEGKCSLCPSITISEKGS